MDQIVVIDESIETIFDHDKQNELLVKIIKVRIKEGCYVYILDENLNVYVEVDCIIQSSVAKYLEKYELQFVLPHTLVKYSNYNPFCGSRDKKILTGVQCGTITSMRIYQQIHEFFGAGYKYYNVQVMQFLNDPSNYPSRVPILK